MSEIPEDIMQSAREAYHSAFNEYGNAKDVDVYAAIARAILAERQRCEAIARNIKGEGEWPAEAWISSSIADAIANAGSSGDRQLTQKEENILAAYQERRLRKGGAA